MEEVAAQVMMVLEIMGADTTCIITVVTIMATTMVGAITDTTTVAVSTTGKCKIELVEAEHSSVSTFVVHYN